MFFWWLSIIFGFLITFNAKYAVSMLCLYISQPCHLARLANLVKLQWGRSCHVMHVFPRGALTASYHNTAPRQPSASTNSSWRELTGGINISARMIRVSQVKNEKKFKLKIWTINVKVWSLIFVVKSENATKSSWESLAAGQCPATLQGTKCLQQ